jgi:hypothetical protein
LKIFCGSMILAAAFQAPAHSAEPTAKPLFGAQPCTSSESWTFNGAILEAKRDDFKAWRRGGIAPGGGVSEALATRRFAQNNETKFLGEYWISRALFDSKLPHIAFNGFASIASKPVTPETAGVQISALGCKLEIQSKYPAIALPEATVANLEAFRKNASTPAMREIVFRGAFLALDDHLGKTPVQRKRVTDEKAEQLAAILQGDGAYENLGLALKAAHVSDHATAVARYERFLADTSMPAPLKRFVNTARILLARELYASQQFEKASAQLKLVTKSANELSAALEELAWSQLMSDRLAESIGTAMNLQVGGLRHAYAPEAPMVAAMALNELCQYPESVRAIRTFQKNYEKSHAWLSAHPLDHLYPLAVQFLKRAPGLTVPDRVASEWVRSPLFIASQDELNLLFDEQDSTVALGRSGAKEQSKIAAELVLRAKPLPARLKAAKAKMKEGDRLPTLLRDDLLALKEMILRYRRLQQGAPVWHTILANYKKTAKATEKKLVATINADLKSRSQRMIGQLDDIAENIQMIEVEIYNGASQDIIWQNAHPEYKKIAQKLKDETSSENAQKGWDWGRAPASLDDEDGEVWEDELGSFAANLFDNCSSKDKYLAIRAGRRE